MQHLTSVIPLGTLDTHSYSPPLYIIWYSASWCIIATVSGCFDLCYWYDIIPHWLNPLFKRSEKLWRTCSLIILALLVFRQRYNAWQGKEEDGILITTSLRAFAYEITMQIWFCWCQTSLDWSKAQSHPSSLESIWVWHNTRHKSAAPALSCHTAVIKKCWESAEIYVCLL